MSQATRETPAPRDDSPRSLTPHLPHPSFERLQKCSILIAGMGGGSNIAELLVRKGVGQLIIADLNEDEPDNAPQRGSASNPWGRSKVEVMRGRLLDINPHATITAIPEGVTLENVTSLVDTADYVVDLIDFHALREKVALHRAARAARKLTLTAPSIMNGAILYIFSPEGPSFEQFFGYEEGIPLGELGLRLLKRLIPRYALEAPPELDEAAARGERPRPHDAVGNAQASVLLVSAVENLVLGRYSQVLTIPQGVQVDVSDPLYLAKIVDFSREFRSAP